MNCYNCNLMFSFKRKRISFQCGYSFCLKCLERQNEDIPNKCPINNHCNCKAVKETKNDDYINNRLDKKAKVVFVGSKGAGKTTLIRSMAQSQKKNINHTVSVDVVSIIRQVKNLIVQYNLWDTVSQSIIFQGFDTTFKNSNVQIIVTKGESPMQIKALFDYVQENTTRPFIMIIKNQMVASQIQKQQQLSSLLKGKKYKYVKIDCMNSQAVNKIWSILDSDCLWLKQSQSKLHGKTIAKLQRASNQNHHKCFC